jgi:hypothetical protein
MSPLSKIARFWSDRMTARAAVQHLIEPLRALTPDLQWVLDDRDPARSSLALADRMVVTLEDHIDGVAARVVEPGQPGDDDAPILLRAAHDVTNRAHSLSWRARIAPGTVALHALRANAVYEVLQDFTDNNEHAYSVGTRLTHALLPRSNDLPGGRQRGVSRVRALLRLR